MPIATNGTFQRLWQNLTRRAPHSAQGYYEVAPNEPGAKLLRMHGIWAASVSPIKPSVQNSSPPLAQGGAHRVGSSAGGTVS